MLVFLDTDCQERHGEKEPVDISIFGVTGASITAYGFFKPGFDPRTDVLICISGVLFAAIPIIVEMIREAIYRARHDIDNCPYDHYRYKYKKRKR